MFPSLLQGWELCHNSAGIAWQEPVKDTSQKDSVMNPAIKHRPKIPTLWVTFQAQDGFL